MLRRILKRSVRRARRLLPYPRLWAIFAGARIPTSYVTGKRTGLFEPEAVAFTPSGDLMAISNSRRHSVSLYTRGDASGRNYERRPCCTISDPNCWRVVHDTAFSPCGRYPVAAARETHALSMFVLLDGNSNEIEAKPLWSVRGEDCGLSFPAGVAIHPSGKWLAVANRARNGITLYRNSGSSGQFDSTPFQIITVEDLSIHGLAAPHGLDFSPDGKSLIVTHKRFFKTEHPKGDSGLSIFKWRTEPNFGLDPHPSFIFPYGLSSLHHVAFHPSGNIVAVSISRAGVDVFDWLPEQEAMSKRDAISFFRIGEGPEGRVGEGPKGRVGEGPKGVAFTREGEQIAVTTNLNEVLFFDLVAGSG